MRERLTDRLLAGAMAVLAGVVVVGLVMAPPPEPDRVAALAERLRCPTCQSVSIADSPSQTAQAMRRTIEEQVAAGRTDEEIVDFFTSRYGQWVLHDPPISGQTWLVWALPPLVLIPGAVAIWRRRRPQAPVELADEDRAAVASELARLHDQAHDWDVEPEWEGR